MKKILVSKVQFFTSFKENYIFVCNESVKNGIFYKVHFRPDIRHARARFGPRPENISSGSSRPEARVFESAQGPAPPGPKLEEYENKKARERKIKTRQLESKD